MENKGNSDFSLYVSPLMFNNISFELGSTDQPLPMGPLRLSSPQCDIQSYAVARAGKTGSGSRDDNHSETDEAASNTPAYLTVHQEICVYIFFYFIYL